MKLVGLSRAITWPAVVCLVSYLINSQLMPIFVDLMQVLPVHPHWWSWWLYPIWWKPGWNGEWNRERVLSKVLKCQWTSLLGSGWLSRANHCPPTSVNPEWGQCRSTWGWRERGGEAEWWGVGCYSASSVPAPAPHSPLHSTLALTVPPWSPCPLLLSRRWSQIQIEIVGI